MIYTRLDGLVCITRNKRLLFYYKGMPDYKTVSQQQRQRERETANPRSKNMFAHLRQEFLAWPCARIECGQKWNAKRAQTHTHTHAVMILSHCHTNIIAAYMIYDTRCVRFRIIKKCQSSLSLSCELKRAEYTHSHITSHD